jgi:hypothetical protein
MVETTILGDGVGVCRIGFVALSACDPFVLDAGGIENTDVFVGVCQELSDL